MWERGRAHTGRHGIDIAPTDRQKYRAEVPMGLVAISVRTGLWHGLGSSAMASAEAGGNEAMLDGEGCRDANWAEKDARVATMGEEADERMRHTGGA